MYCYIMGLFFASVLSNTIALIARVMRLEDTDMYIEFTNTWTWHLRVIPMLIILFSIVAHMSWRVFAKRNKELNE